MRTKFFGPAVVALSLEKPVRTLAMRRALCRRGAADAVRNSASFPRPTRAGGAQLRSPAARKICARSLVRSLSPRAAPEPPPPQRAGFYFSHASSDLLSCGLLAPYNCGHSSPSLPLARDSSFFLFRIEATRKRTPPQKGPPTLLGPSRITIGPNARTPIPSKFWAESGLLYGEQSFSISSRHAIQ